MPKPELVVEFKAIVNAIKSGKFYESELNLGEYDLDDADLQQLINAFIQQPTVAAKIISLALHENLISIAPDIFAAGLVNLKVIFLHDNCLKLAPDYSAHKNLEEIYLQQNPMPYIPNFSTKMTVNKVTYSEPEGRVGKALRKIANTIYSMHPSDPSDELPNNAARMLSENLFEQYFTEYASTLRAQQHKSFYLNAERFFTTYICLSKYRLPLELSRMVLDGLIYQGMESTPALLAKHVEYVKGIFSTAIAAFDNNYILQASLNQLQQYLDSSYPRLVAQHERLAVADHKVIFKPLEDHTSKVNKSLCQYKINPARPLVFSMIGAAKDNKTDKRKKSSIKDKMIKSFSKLCYKI